MSIENGGGGGLKGKGLDRLRQKQEEDAKKYSGELKGKGLHQSGEGVEQEDEFAVGKIFINRDQATSNPDTAEYEVESVKGELGKRHIVLRNQKIKATIGKSEESMRDALSRGVWRKKVE